MIDRGILEKKYKSSEDEEEYINNQIEQIKQYYGENEDTYKAVIKQYFGAKLTEE